LTDHNRNVSEEPPIDITIRRECVYQQFKGEPGPCPRCGGPLQQSRQSYLVATRRGGKITDSFVVGSDMGWFCTRCPTVVINSEDVGKLFQHGLPHWDIGSEFVVLGIIDLDAVPEEKQHLPLGDEDNPIPLVEFTNISRKTAPGRPARRRKPPRKRAAPTRKKTKRKKRHR
jgi:hypothetical protein